MRVGSTSRPRSASAAMVMLDNDGEPEDGGHEANNGQEANGAGTDKKEKLFKALQFGHCIDKVLTCEHLNLHPKQKRHKPA